MLREQGYEPVGMTMRVWNDGADAVQEAAALAARLGMEHHVVDVRKEFEEMVVADFINGCATVCSNSACSSTVLTGMIAR